MPAMMIVHSARHARHATTLDLPGCPIKYLEIPARAESVLGAIRGAELGSVIEPKDFGMEPLRAVHCPAFIDHLQQAYERSRPFYEGTNAAIADTFCSPGLRHRPTGWPGKLGYYMFDAACPILEGTWEAAYWSSQCAVTAADLVRSGARAVYALCRPPGHHAASDLHGGFCYLNNAAIAASFLHRQTGRRVAILDIDYHHGNGTQEIFYANPDVLFCSLHADPDLDYPFFWGGRDERGEGAGVGANFNWPLPHRATSGEYLAALAEAATVIRQFGPSYLVLSAGFDFMDSDPAPLAKGAFQIDMSALSSIARTTADLHLPTVIVQEGGYDVERLGSYVVRFLKEFNEGSSG
jgi:acetoin utilization deacetylase AcuC-like enzyme